MTTETVTIPAARVRVGDRPANISGSITRIQRVPGGFVFDCEFGVSFVRNHDESVTIKK